MKDRETIHVASTTRALGTTVAHVEQHDRRHLRLGDRRLLRAGRGIRARLREALTMEYALVGTVGALLIVYLFWTLVRPEDF